jgi:hypothetical protein
MKKLLKLLPLVLIPILVFVYSFESPIDPGGNLGAIVSFGKTTDGTNVQTFSGDRIYLSSASPSSSGTITSCWGRVRVTGASTSEIRFVIFADNGSTPNGGAILAVSEEVIVNWTTSTLTEFDMTGVNEIAVSTSTQYWLGFWADDPGTPSYEYKRDNTAGQVHFAGDAYPGSGTPTTPFTSGGTANGPLNAYCEYEDAPGGGGGGGATSTPQSTFYF